MLASHIIQDITFSATTISIRIDGKSYTLALDKLSSKLLSATELQRGFYKISPSGYGIHWPLIDEDLSVEAIIKTSAA
jgi:hypothetical protein